MNVQTAFTLVNPQTKALAFKIYAFEDDSYFNKLNNFNYYSILLITKGSGEIQAESSKFNFSSNCVLCFSVYQPFMLKAKGELKGVLINFHPDFFCIHKHQPEIACNGVLFNNIYESPVTNLKDQEALSLMVIVDDLKSEMQNAALAQYELLVSYLKIFLINASRIKLSRTNVVDFKVDPEPFILKTLKDNIEEHYRTKHNPGYYSDGLNISTRALNRISKSHFNKTLTNLIAERIVIEAKRELYLTSKSIKAIAYELGFTDEFYFSRFFKSNAMVSPQSYRETVGQARDES